MTVHKSKGLEFPIVIFPYANAEIYREKDAKLWLPVDKKSYAGFEELLISQNKQVLHYGTQAEKAYELAQHQLELDAFNVLYVALTRAINQLYIITKKEVDKQGNAITTKYSGIFMHYLQQKGLWNEDKLTYSFGVFDIKPENTTLKPQNNIPYLYAFKDRPGFRILAKQGMLWDSDRQQALEQGNLIHYAMSFVTTHSEVPSVLNRLRSQGVLSAAELSYVAAKMEQITQHPELKRFYEAGLLIKNEKDIITKNGLILRPDRVLIAHKKATIIDYKTGKPNTSYHEQLHQYANALKEMGYTIAHKILVYINEQVTTAFI